MGGADGKLARTSPGVVAGRTGRLSKLSRYSTDQDAARSPHFFKSRLSIVTTFRLQFSCRDNHKIPQIGSCWFYHK